MKKSRATLMILLSAALFFILGFYKNAYSDKWAIFLTKVFPETYPLIINQTSLDNQQLQIALFQDRQTITRIHSQENVKNPSLQIGYLKRLTNYDQLIEGQSLENGGQSLLDESWFNGIKPDFLSDLTTQNKNFIPLLWKIEESKACKQIWLKILGIKVFQQTEKVKRLSYHVRDLLPKYFSDYKSTTIFDLKDYRLEQLKIKPDNSSTCVP